MRITRDGSAARNPTGNSDPSVIGTSPKMSPGCRSPTTRSTPSTSFTASIRPPDPTGGQGEQRAGLGLLSGVFAGCERDICRHPREPLARVLIELGEDLDPADFLCGHHRLTPGAAY